MRLIIAVKCLIIYTVSIHAPTRGATRLRLLKYLCVIWFQSTHPHGVRQSLSVAMAETSDSYGFNPRTHTGCDSAFCRISINSSVVSIHAPTRGATLVYAYINMLNIVSIHAPTRGATMWFRFVFSRSMFQSTHPHGVRHIAKRRPIYTSYRFNPRTHTGCDSVQSYIL